MQDTTRSEAAPVHLLEHLIVDTVEAYGYAVQSGVFKVLGLLGKKVAVGGEGNV